VLFFLRYCFNLSWGKYGSESKMLLETIGLSYSTESSESWNIFLLPRPKSLSQLSLIHTYFVHAAVHSSFPLSIVPSRLLVPTVYN